MIITFKKFKQLLSVDKRVYFGKVEDVSTESCFLPVQGRCKEFPVFNIPEKLLSDGYKLEVFSVRPSWPYYNIPKGPRELDPSSEIFYVAAPNLEHDVIRYYRRRYKYCINEQILSAASPVIRKWLVQENYLAKRNKVCLLEASYGDWKITDYERVSDEKECAKMVRQKLVGIKRAFKNYLENAKLNNETEYLKYLADIELERKKALEAEKKAQKLRKLEEEYGKNHLFYSDGEKCSSVAIFLCHALNVGTHTGYFRLHFAESNEVVCIEEKDWNGYAKSCRFPMIHRHFEVKIKEGYSAAIVGGLITFHCGPIKRTGIACEWVEQGKKITDLRTVKGYLVRGEHIEAKSLAEAQRISKEKRAKLAFELIQKRAKLNRDLELLKGHKATFEDSLAAGNCRQGTMAFKNRYEAAIGHEATEISLADLRRYGKMFNLERFTERVVNYVLTHSK